MAATDILGKIGEKVGGQIKTLESTITNDFATKAELGTLQSEVDTTQTGAGLGTGGTYTASGSSTYLTAATSLVDADNKLDAQAKANADAISANASAIDTVEASAGLGADGAYIAETNSNYIDEASSLAEADSLLDTQIGTNATNISTNAGNITSLTNDKYDKTGGTISGAVTITGNLTVQGETTTVRSTEVSVADNTIEVNLKSDGSVTASTGGFNVNRGDDVNGDPNAKAGLIWDNDNSTWKLQLGTAAADLSVATVTGNLTGNVTGNVTGDVTGSLAAPNANGITVNNVSLGDYSTFESAFNSAIA